MENKTLRNRINTYLYDNIIALLSIKKQYMLEYRRLQGEKLNLKEPRKLTEKLFWLMRYNELYKKELIQKIYDKNSVRDYIKEKGLEHILIKQIGHYQTPDEIDWSELPNQFALKMTQSCGENVICKNKKDLNEDEVKAKFYNWKQEKKSNKGLQNYYFTDKESIVCEELLVDDSGNIPIDFRVCCCNGEPRFIYCDIDSLDDNNDKKKVYYRECFDTEWNYLPVDFVNRPRKNEKTPYTKKPNNFEEIMQIARVLSEDFIFVRVDFYLVKDQIFFGELTPLPGLSGGFKPKEWDLKFGEMLTLPNKEIF